MILTDYLVNFRKLEIFKAIASSFPFFLSLENSRIFSCICIVINLNSQINYVC